MNTFLALMQKALFRERHFFDKLVKKKNAQKIRDITFALSVESVEVPPSV